MKKDIEFNQLNRHKIPIRGIFVSLLISLFWGDGRRKSLPNDGNTLTRFCPTVNILSICVIFRRYNNSIQLIKIFYSFIFVCLTFCLLVGDAYAQWCGRAEHYIARRVAEESKTGSTGWSAVTGTAASGTTASTNGWIDDTNFTAGDRYLILINGYHDTDNNQGRSGIRVTHGGTAFGESEGTIETDRTGSAYKTSYFWFTVWTAVASEDIEVQFYNDNATHTSRVQDITLVAINAEDLISNNDLQFDTDTGGGTLTTTPTAVVTLSWTPDNNNDTWWIMSYFQADIVDVGNDYFEAQIDVDGSNEAITSFEGEDAADTPVMGIGWEQQLSNAAHTISLELSESAANEEWDAAGIFALRMEAFLEYSTDSTNGTITLNAGDDIYNEIATVTDTPTYGRSWLVVGGHTCLDNNARCTTRIQQDDTTQIAGEFGGYQYDTANDQMPWTGMDIADYTQATAVQFDMDSRETRASTDPVSNDPWLVAFPIEGPRCRQIMRAD